MPTPLERFLLTLAGEPILYAPNPGNAGDAIIASATYQLFERLGLAFESVELDCPRERTRGRTVIYGGGGNLVEFYSDAGGFISRHHHHAKRLIVLPQTVRGHADLLAALGPNVTIICRDADSYAHVRSLLKTGTVELMDDVAFSLDVPAFMGAAEARYQPLFSSPAHFSLNARRLKWRARHAVRNLLHPKVLNAFRTDRESRGRRLPSSNLDVSQVFMTDDMRREYADEATYRAFQFLAPFEAVNTDRLHVCIASLLLGKAVNFYDNNYGKNRAVYEFSMRGRYPRLTWQEEGKLSSRDGEIQPVPGATADIPDPEQP